MIDLFFVGAIGAAIGYLAGLHAAGAAYKAKAERQQRLASYSNRRR